jgi:hypothetical protein
MDERAKAIFGTDKIFWHRYHEVYEGVFSNLHGTIQILEFGTFRGDSVRYLLDRFPEAKVVSADIVEHLESWPSDPRVEYAQIDQGDRKQISALLRDQASDWDLVIEDGSHHPGHQRDCLLESLSFLKKGSTYIVEDIHTSQEQLRNFGLISPAVGGFINDQAFSTFGELLKHMLFVKLVTGFPNRPPRPKINLLTLLLALERRQALGERLSEREVNQLSSDGFFTENEVRELDQAITSVQLYRRAGLPLSCHECSSQNFELALLRCECGTRLYKDDDSMAAILKF